MNNIKFAVIGPSFFGYCEAIASEFERKGTPAIYINELPSENLLRKIFYRLGLSRIIKKEQENHLKKIIEKLKRKNISEVLIISPELCNSIFCEKLLALGFKVKVYIWDSLKNRPLAKDYIKKFSGVASFDMIDCTKKDLIYIPLFAEPDFFKRNESSNKTVDISFVGTLHSNRMKLINNINNFCITNKLVFDFIGYYYSGILFLLKFIFSGLHFSIFKKVTFKKMKKIDIGKLYNKSNFVLDIHHKDQNGLTSRSFEALMSGACLITTNKNYISLPYNLSKRCLYISADSIVESLYDLKIDFKNFNLSNLSDEQEHFLSISRFVDQINELKDIKHR
jgi:hypothetical protein